LSTGLQVIPALHIAHATPTSCDAEAHLCALVQKPFLFCTLRMYHWGWPELYVYGVYLLVYYTVFFGREITKYTVMYGVSIYGSGQPYTCSVGQKHKCKHYGIETVPVLHIAHCTCSVGQKHKCEYCSTKAVPVLHIAHCTLHMFSGAEAQLCTSLVPTPFLRRMLAALN
jgi:hypothetical protein